MKCVYCNNEINEKDKFCQFCGSLVVKQTEAPEVAVPQVAPEPMPVVEQPVQAPMQPQLPVQQHPQMEPSMNNQPQMVNNYQQPANPIPPKQGKSGAGIVVGILVALVVLIGVIILVLVVTAPKDEAKAKGKEEKEVIDEPVEVVKKDTTSKVTLGDMTLELPSEISAVENMNGTFLMDKENVIFESSVEKIEYRITQLDPDKTSTNIQNNYGVAASYRKVDKGYIFSFYKDGYNYEVVYFDVDGVTIAGGMIVIKDNSKYTNLKEKLYTVYKTVKFETLQTNNNNSFKLEVPKPATK